jgi:hypothetical protein
MKGAQGGDFWWSKFEGGEKSWSSAGCDFAG